MDNLNQAPIPENKFAIRSRIGVAIGAIVMIASLFIIIMNGFSSGFGSVSVWLFIPFFALILIWGSLMRSSKISKEGNSQFLQIRNYDIGFFFTALFLMCLGFLVSMMSNGQEIIYLRIIFGLAVSFWFMSIIFTCINIYHRSRSLIILLIMLITLIISIVGFLYSLFLFGLLFVSNM